MEVNSNLVFQDIPISIFIQEIHRLNPGPFSSQLLLWWNVCKASRKWHTSKSQPPFTCDCGVSSSGSRTLSVGGAPQAREVCVVPQEQCGVVTLCDLPGPPEPLHHCLKERNQTEKDQYKSYPPMTAPSAAAGRGQRVLDPGPTLPQKGHRWVSMLSCHRAVSPASKIFGIRANLWK